MPGRTSAQVIRDAFEHALEGQFEVLSLNLGLEHGNGGHTLDDGEALKRFRQGTTTAWKAYHMAIDAVREMEIT